MVSRSATRMASQPAVRGKMLVINCSQKNLFIHQSKYTFSLMLMPVIINRQWSVAKLVVKLGTPDQHHWLG